MRPAIRPLIGIGLAALATLALAQAPTPSTIDINTASVIDLDGTKGIGPALSARILAARADGPFRDWADLRRRVSGIGEATARKLSGEGLTVGGQPYRVTSDTR